MAFQTPITVKKALDQVHRHEYVLPAIQREFVWKTVQIERLLDSLMRGYPIGSFLFWRVNRENLRQYKFYDFVLNYHQRDAPLCAVVVSLLDSDSPCQEGCHESSRGSPETVCREPRQRVRVDSDDVRLGK